MMIKIAEPVTIKFLPRLDLGGKVCGKGGIVCGLAALLSITKILLFGKKICQAIEILYYADEKYGPSQTF
jgi:hypothetical protein